MTQLVNCCKESTFNAGDLGSIPGLGRFPGEGKGYPLQYSCLENSNDCIVCGGHKGSDMTEQLSLYEDTKLNFIKMKCKPELYLPSIKLRKDM